GALHDGLDAINTEVETLENNQTTFTDNLTTKQSNFESTVNNKFDEANKLMEDTKNLVDNSKDLVQNASDTTQKINDVNQKVIRLGNEFVISLQSNENRFSDLRTEIPRVNLILASNFESDDGSDALLSKEYGFARTTTAIQVVEGNTYTFTVCGYITDSAKKEGGGLKVCLYDADWSPNGANILITETDKIIKSETFVATKTEYLYVSSYLSPENTAYTGQAGISWYSLVEGNVPAKEWTACPYDLNGGVNLFGNSNFGKDGFVTSANGACYSVSEVELQAGYPYVFTACASTEENTNNSGATCMLYTSDWSECYTLFFEVNSSYTKSIIFIPTTTQKFNFGFYSREKNGTNHNINCTLKWYTVAQGSRPQAWIPSMGDIRGRTSLQLATIGRQTAQMMLVQNNSQKKTQEIGKTTTQLMLENQQLKQQIKSIGKMMVQMQLNKK
ncbi:MAG: hypothetical protein ACRDDY_09440, partial [Clostridium sp.]|uniref:hypothetical protein n=1 Tax=Clostridium sp. TaxID=1506 RepID=UPI003EE75A61